MTPLSSEGSRPPVAVFGVGAGCGGDLALGLSDLGAPLALLCQEEEAEAAEFTAAAAVSSGRVATVAPYDPASAVSIADAIAKAADQIGDIRAVIDIANPGAAGSPGPLGDVGPGAWDERVTTPLRDALHRLQGSYRALRARGGRIVVVLPSLSMSGAADLVAWTTLSEGQRALAKVAARGWGAEAITVNCLGIPAHFLSPVGGAPLDRPGLPERSLGRPPDVRSDVAGAVAALIGPQLAFVTGATLAVDGGVWMTP